VVVFEAPAQSGVLCDLPKFSSRCKLAKKFVFALIVTSPLVTYNRTRKDSESRLVIICAGFALELFLRLLQAALGATDPNSSEIFNLPMK